MIKIVVVAYNNEEPTLPMSAVFGHEGATLGRSEDNYFVLPDSRHYVSRLQASIKSDGERHTITNLSKANPILINGQEIDSDREYDLQAGDEIQIGLYLLRAESMSSGAYVGRPAGPKDAAHAVGDRIDPVTVILATPGSAEAKPAQTSATPRHAAQASPATAPSATDPSTEQAPASNSVDGVALMQAFLHGAGIPANTITSGLTPELMEMFGKLLATAIQGTIALNSSRTEVKREVNADMTMVVVRNNNPLKFFPDSQTVMTQMLRKKMPGFMGPVESMQDALEDLRTHQLAVVAGTRASLHEQLNRFNPAHLEKKLKDSSFLDSLLPANRKARLWDMHTSLFSAISQESQDDAHVLYGKAFLNAYEKEIERIRDGAHDA